MPADARMNVTECGALGAPLCMLGFGFPAIAETWHMGFGTGWVLEVGSNLFVCLFVIGGPLAHLLAPDPAAIETI